MKLINQFGSIHKIKKTHNKKIKALIGNKKGEYIIKYLKGKKDN